MILDYGVILIGAVFVFICLYHSDILEYIVNMSRKYEKLELDELIVLGLYFMVAFLILSIRQLKETKRNEKELKEKNEEIRKNLDEKYLLLREVNHRVKNNIVLIESMMSIQRMKTENTLCRTILDDAIGRVHSMSCLYEKLVQSTSFTNISLKQYLSDLIPSIITLFDDSSTSSLKMDLEDINIDAERLTAVGIIVNEIITNSLKYGASDNKFELSVSLKTEGGKIHLIIRDNGKGFPVNNEVKQRGSLGMTIIHGLIQQINAEIKMQNKNGAETTIIINDTLHE